MSAGTAWPGTVGIVDGCTACGLCIQTCPESALRRAPRQPHVVDDRCTGCLACIEVCPRDCIVELLPPADGPLVRTEQP